MRFTSSFAAAAALLSTAEAAYKGFNYGAFFGNNQAKVYNDFRYEFEAAKALPGTNSQFTSARLYTMIQHGTANTPIEALQAAIDTKTYLLLGIWASAGQTVVNNEITALKSAISKFGTKFTDLVVGISVGSEDLYRITPTAIQNGETNPGAQPSELVNYINQVRAAIKGTGLASKPIGHVDTWTAFVNGTNSPVINAIDFLGVDAYPYWQTQMANSINNANATFYDSYRQTVAAAKGKAVWVTETGWPVSGPQQNQAVASAANARTYWKAVSCSLMQGNINLFYYTLQDVQYSTPSPSFGIKPGGDLKAVNPLFDLSCSNSKPNETTNSNSSSTGTPTSSSVSTFNGSTTLTTLTKSTGSSGVVITSSKPTVFSSQSLVIPPAMSSFIWPSPRPPPPKPSQTPLSKTPLPAPSSDQPNGLRQPFVAPNLIVPIDSSDPDKVVGNSYIAQISPTRATLFMFDVPPDFPSVCNLVFAVPPDFNAQFASPIKLKSQGGISVSQLDDLSDSKMTASTADPSHDVGRVPLLEPGNKYHIASLPGMSGQKVGYRVDSTNGLDLDFFETNWPPLGLFLEVA